MVAPRYLVWTPLWLCLWWTASAWDEENESVDEPAHPAAAASSSVALVPGATSSQCSASWTYTQYMQFMAAAWDEEISVAAQLEDYENATVNHSGLVMSTIESPTPESDMMGALRVWNLETWRLLHDGRVLRGGRGTTTGLPGRDPDTWLISNNKAKGGETSGTIDSLPCPCPASLVGNDAEDGHNHGTSSSSSSSFSAPWTSWIGMSAAILHDLMGEYAGERDRVIGGGFVELELDPEHQPAPRL
ncbi:unnamed protein product [Symbiodinium sp. CCMP2592]|nr:unnamed protein product [Symbiodinium sp. CCMP2592]